MSLARLPPFVDAGDPDQRSWFSLDARVQHLNVCVVDVILRVILFREYVLVTKEVFSSECGGRYGKVGAVQHKGTPDGLECILVGCPFLGRPVARLL
jgi:hypothetical protein